MIRFTRTVAVLAAISILPTAANALGISIANTSSTAGPLGALENNAVVTVDLVVENSTAERVYGLGLGFRGTDPDGNGLENSGLSFLGGQVAASVFNVVLTPTPLGGLPNIRSAPLVQNPGPYPVVVGLNRWVSIFESVSTTGATGDGSLDDGVDGGSVGSGDVHFRLQFLATSAAVARSLTLEFGVLGDYGQGAIGDGGTLLPFSNATLELRVIPEPGTVLLMGLGLMGLAARRR